TTFKAYTNEVRLIYCDGSNFFSTVLNPLAIDVTSTKTLTIPPGYSHFRGLLWGGGGGGGGGIGAGAGGGGGCGRGPGERRAAGEARLQRQPPSRAARRYLAAVVVAAPDRQRRPAAARAFTAAMAALAQSRAQRPPDLSPAAAAVVPATVQAGSAVPGNAAS